MHRRRLPIGGGVVRADRRESARVAVAILTAFHAEIHGEADRIVDELDGDQRRELALFLAGMVYGAAADQCLALHCTMEQFLERMGQIAAADS